MNRSRRALWGEAPRPASPGSTCFGGKTTAYTYDTQNRLLSKTPDATLGEVGVAFTYATTGKRASMTDASGTTTYGYDNQDRLTSKASPQAR